MNEDQYSEIQKFYGDKFDSYPARINRLEYDKRKNAKANLRKLMKNYTVIDNAVHYKDKARNTTKIVPRRCEVEKILKDYHDHPVAGGHLGRDKTKAKIGEVYYWTGK